MRKRTSIIWKTSDDQFIRLVKESKTMSILLRHFGLQNKGHNHKTCRERINYLGLNTIHFLNRIASSNYTRKISVDDFCKRLIEHCPHARTHLRKGLIKFKLIPYQCECGNIGIWRDKNLSLQLEYKNGVSDDYRIENLMFLCPNCHSQTTTFAGRKNTGRSSNSQDTALSQQKCWMRFPHDPPMPV